MFKDFNYLKAAIGMIVGFSLVFAFCRKTKDTETVAGDGGMKGNITVSYLQQAKWKISYLNNNGKEETTRLSGYELLFKDDGTVTATKEGSPVSGKWAYKWDDNKYKLYLDFGSSPVNSLNNDWEILHATTFNIRLQDIDGSGGGTDYLTLESN